MFEAGIEQREAVSDGIIMRREAPVFAARR